MSSALHTNTALQTKLAHHGRTVLHNGRKEQKEEKTFCSSAHNAGIRTARYETDRKKDATGCKSKAKLRASHKKLSKIQKSAKIRMSVAGRKGLFTAESLDISSVHKTLFFFSVSTIE